MAKKRKPKLSPEEIMARIIDNDLLENRKEIKQQKQETIEVVEEKPKKEEKKWFQQPMTKDKFTIKEHNNKYYAHYKGWKDNIWIGAYDTEKELNDVIKSYVKETKKSPIHRNLTNIHSIIIDLE